MFKNWAITTLSAASLALGVAFSIYSVAQLFLVGTIFFLSVSQLLSQAISKRDGAKPAEWIHKFKGPLTVEMVCGKEIPADWGTDDWAKVTCLDCLRLKDARAA